MRGRATLVGVLASAVAAALVGCTAQAPAPSPVPHPHATVAVTTCAADPERLTKPLIAGAGEELIPFTPTDLLVCHYGTGTVLELQKQIDDPNVVSKIARSLNTQRFPFPTGGMSCPADSGEMLRLFFWNATDMIEISVGMSGCGGFFNGIEAFLGGLTGEDRRELGLPPTPDPFATGIPATPAP